MVAKAAQQLGGLHILVNSGSAPGRKLSAFVLQALLLGGELKVQTLGPPSPMWPVF
jgi:hypothetical protein